MRNKSLTGPALYHNNVALQHVKDLRRGNKVLFSYVYSSI